MRTGDGGKMSGLADGGVDGVLKLRTNIDIEPPGSSSQGGNSSNSSNSPNRFGNDEFAPYFHLTNYLRKTIFPNCSLGKTQLKSLIQKNVRRRRPLPAVRIALLHLLKDPIDFWRRIPIVITEDAVFGSEGIASIWLMIALGKGWRITSEKSAKVIVEIAMDAVWKAASCK